jgi:hypothetical protein
MIFCVPGPWQDRSDFIRRVVNSESDGRYVYDGNVLADVRHQDILKVEFLGRHPRMLKAFQAASRGDLPRQVEEEIAGHSSSIYLRFPLSLVEERLRVLKYTQMAQRWGGFAIKLESSGVGHSWERWFRLVSSDNEFDWYCAVVMLLAGDSYYYSCGMHHFGLADSAVERRFSVEEAANLLNKFNYWRLIEQRALRSGESFSLSEASTLFRLQLKADELNPEDDLFHNPHGLWHLERI